MDPNLLAVVSGVLSGGLVGGIVTVILQHRLQTRLTRESQLLEQKRRVYQSLVQSMRLFVGDRRPAQNEENAFLSAYDSLWLWASDNIIQGVNELVVLLRRHAAGENVSQTDLKRAYSRCVIAMRREIGFPLTGLTEADLQYITVVRPS
jgi:hypothetical protein